jgi:hypothetical protein
LSLPRFYNCGDRHIRMRLEAAPFPAKSSQIGGHDAGRGQDLENLGLTVVGILSPLGLHESQAPRDEIQSHFDKRDRPRREKTYKLDRSRREKAYKREGQLQAGESI